jgi:hypothetical protein
MNPKTTTIAHDGLGRSIQLSDTLLGCAGKEKNIYRCGSPCCRCWTFCSLEILGRVLRTAEHLCEPPASARAAHTNSARKEHGGWAVEWVGEALPDKRAPRAHSPCLRPLF